MSARDRHESPSAPSPADAGASVVASSPRALKTRLAWELQSHFDRRRVQRAKETTGGDKEQTPGSPLEPYATFHDAFDAFETELASQPTAALARPLFDRFERATRLPSMSPAEFCHLDRASGLPLLHWLENAFDVPALNSHALYVFFEWVIDGLPSAVDDNGHWTRSPDHLNPMVREDDLDYKPRALRAMPTRYFLAACELLLENNFAWPSRLPDDGVTVRDASTGATTLEWNPVRAGALLLKFLLPLATNDLRFVESVETDASLRDRAEEDRGLGRPRGFLQPMAAGAHNVLGVRVPGGTIAPTRRRFPDLSSLNKCGYDVPLERPGVIALVAMLEAFQKRFNPVAKPLSWDEVSQSPFAHLPRPVQRRLKGAHFLLRDVQHVRGPAHPVSAERLNHLWLALLAKLEERLLERGERAPNGEPVVLVRRWDPLSATPLLPVYTLDSLRVSCIANLRQMGIVPPTLLAQLAGHEWRPRRRMHATCGQPPVAGNPYAEAIRRHEHALRLRLLEQEARLRESSRVPPDPPPRPRTRFRR